MSNAICAFVFPRYCCWVAKSCPALVTPSSPPGSSVGISQAGALEWVALFFSSFPSLSSIHIITHIRSSSDNKDNDNSNHHSRGSALGTEASCRDHSFNLAIILWYQHCYHLCLQMRNPRHVDCVACPRYTDDTHRSWDFSLLCISLHSHWTHFFLRSVHHSYTSYMFVFNCLIEFCCTISRFSHPFLSIPLLGGSTPLTVTDSGQWAIRYKFLCVHMQEFLWVKGMCIYRISTNCRILLWSSCIK